MLASVLELVEEEELRATICKGFVVELVEEEGFGRSASMTTEGFCEGFGIGVGIGVLVIVRA